MRDECDLNTCAIDMSKIQHLGLIDSSTDFLRKSSLPSSTVLHVTFATTNGTFPSLKEYCDANNLPKVEDSADLYRIGSDEGTELCLRMRDSAVVSIDPIGEIEGRFVNSNIESFLGCLDEYARYAEKVEGLNDDDGLKLARTTIAKLHEADPKAFSTSNDWWSCVAEQMELGTL